MAGSIEMSPWLEAGDDGVFRKILTDAGEPVLCDECPCPCFNKVDIRALELVDTGEWEDLTEEPMTDYVPAMFTAHDGKVNVSVRSSGHLAVAEMDPRKHFHGFGVGEYTSLSCCRQLRNKTTGENRVVGCKCAYAGRTDPNGKEISRAYSPEFVELKDTVIVGRYPVMGSDRPEEQCRVKSCEYMKSYMRYVHDALVGEVTLWNGSPSFHEGDCAFMLMPGADASNQDLVCNLGSCYVRLPHDDVYGPPDPDCLGYDCYVLSCDCSEVTMKSPRKGDWFELITGLTCSADCSMRLEAYGRFFDYGSYPRQCGEGVFASEVHGSNPRRYELGASGGGYGPGYYGVSFLFAALAEKVTSDHKTVKHWYVLDCNCSGRHFVPVAYDMGDPGSGGGEYEYDVQTIPYKGACKCVDYREIYDEHWELFGILDTSWGTNSAYYLTPIPREEEYPGMEHLDKPRYEYYTLGDFASNKYDGGSIDYNVMTAIQQRNDGMYVIGLCGPEGTSMDRGQGGQYNHEGSGVMSLKHGPYESVSFVEPVEPFVKDARFDWMGKGAESDDHWVWRGDCLIWSYSFPREEYSGSYDTEAGARAWLAGKSADTDYYVCGLYNYYEYGPCIDPPSYPYSIRPGKVSRSDYDGKWSAVGPVAVIIGPNGSNDFRSSSIAYRVNYVRTNRGVLLNGRGMKGEVTLRGINDHLPSWLPKDGNYSCYGHSGPPSHDMVVHHLAPPNPLKEGPCDSGDLRGCPGHGFMPVQDPDPDPSPVADPNSGQEGELQPNQDSGGESIPALR